MQSKILILLILSLAYLPITQAEEISVVDADTTWNLTLNDTNQVGRLTGDPNVIVVKYADALTYKSLEAASDVGKLIGGPGVMVVKYADAIGYNPLEDPDSIQDRKLELTINHPQNGALILEPAVEVNGTAVSPDEITQVTVNGVLATGTTSWSAEIPLSTGANTITVEAVTSTSYNRTESIQVFHYTEGNYTDLDGDGVIDAWDSENNTTHGYLVNPQGIGFLFGDFNDNGTLDSGDVTLLMQKILEVLP